MSARARACRCSVPVGGGHELPSEFHQHWHVHALSLQHDPRDLRCCCCCGCGCVVRCGVALWWLSAAAASWCAALWWPSACTHTHTWEATHPRSTAMCVIPAQHPPRFLPRTSVAPLRLRGAGCGLLWGGLPAAAHRTRARTRATETDEHAVGLRAGQASVSWPRARRVHPFDSVEFRVSAIQS